MSVRGWRLGLVLHPRQRHLALSLWRHDILVLGVGWMGLPGGPGGATRWHAFADFRGRSWAYFQGLGRM